MQQASVFSPFGQDFNFDYIATLGPSWNFSLSEILASQAFSQPPFRLS
jgi:hypothetical protein